MNVGLQGVITRHILMIFCPKTLYSFRLSQLGTRCQCFRGCLQLKSYTTWFIEITSKPNVITSQRGSAWQCYIGRWLSIRKHAFFHLSPWKSHWKLFWWDLQTRKILLRSVFRGRLHTEVKCNVFVTVVLPFFIYTFSTFPHLAYRSQFSTDSHAW